MFNFPVFITLYAGFTHAFETDHLLAVSTIVSTRNQAAKAVKDGMYWGLGHTSTIFIVGAIVLLLKLQLNEKVFNYFEAVVGLMLITLGGYRVYKWFTNRKGLAKEQDHHADEYNQPHSHGVTFKHEHPHLPAYNIGLVHGLAGSGSLMVLVISQAPSIQYALIYLMVFGAGSISGMMVAASAFSLPFTRQALQFGKLQAILIFLSAGLSITYGGWVVYSHL